VLTLASIVMASRFDLASIETDFSRLRRRDTWTEGERFWGGKMDRLLGRYLSPTVMLADSPEQARALAARVREAASRPPLSTMVAEVRGLDDVVPPDQDAKLAEIARIRALITPAVRAEVAPEKLAALDRFLGDGALTPVQERDVPSGLTAGLRERDGRLGRAVLVFPRPSQQTWQGQQLAIMVGELRKLAATENARVAGALPLSADIIASIQHDGPIASLAALVGVMVLVLLMFRKRVYGVYVIASLLVGVLWMLAVSMLLRIKINFANFIAFPITFGIGVDYAVNVMSRYVQDGEDDIQGAIRSTGAAVGLCSLTTIIGYSSLLLAQNQGLFLFGLMAVIGEITCLVTAIALLPAVLRLLARRRRLAPSRSVT
jgi:uncharacterized protein